MGNLLEKTPGPADARPGLGRQDAPDTSLASDGLFPLPLTPFERYMLTDHRPDYPMSFLLHFDFAGQLQRPAFEAALEETVARHPLLRARVEHSLRRGPCFVDASAEPPALDWDQVGVPAWFMQSPAIDITRETGLRVWVRQGTDRSMLCTQFHHACCDGLGAARFLGDLFAAYGIRSASDGPRPETAPINRELLRTRGQFRVELPEPVSLPRIVWSTLCEGAKWAVRRPTPLALPSPAARLANDSLELPVPEVHEFDQQESRELRQAAARRDATLNDLLLAAVYGTLVQWNEEHRPGGAPCWLQVNMPQNLRTAAAKDLPATNHMSYTFLTRRSNHLADRTVVLESIRQETKAIKQWSLGMYFIAGLDWGFRIPGLCRWVLGRRRCLATTVFSNLGDFGRRLPGNFPLDEGRLVLGNVRLESIRGVPALRPLTYASFAAFSYAGRLCINVYCDPHWFTPADSRQLLTRFVEQVRLSSEAC